MNLLAALGLPPTNWRKHPNPVSILEDLIARCVDPIQEHQLHISSGNLQSR